MSSRRLSYDLVRCEADMRRVRSGCHYFRPMLTDVRMPIAFFILEERAFGWK